MKVKYIDIVGNGAIGCLANKASVRICLDDIRTYSPTSYYLSDEQANELYEKLGRVILENKNNPVSYEIKRLFDEKQ